MLRISFIAAAALIAFPAQAALVAKQQVEKEIVAKDAQGVEHIKRVVAEAVKPGEQVVYTLNYANDATAPADSVVLVMPVPKEITYVEGSVAGGGAVTFSADGGKTYLARGRLTVTEDGAERPAKNADITHIKWILGAPVAPKSKGEVSFQGVLK